jgi:hypothetical protein
MSAYQAPSDERVMDAMIEITRLSESQRVIVAGPHAFDTYLGLLDRGFLRAVTTVTCRIPCGQHDVALITGRHSPQALEAVLVRIVPFLTIRALLAVWTGYDGHQRARALQQLLERSGFRIEAGARCEGGFVLCARRQERSPAANAA